MSHTNQGQILIFIFFVILKSTFSFAESICSSTNRVKIDKSFRPLNIAKIKVAFFDADSTLRVSQSGSVSANSVTDVLLLPFMKTKLLNLLDENFLIYIVSNQGGVSSGIITCDIAEGALMHTMQLLKEAGSLKKDVIHGFDFAENNDQFRKPGIGMAQKLERELKKLYGPRASIDKSQSIMVGDSAFKKNVDIKPDGTMGTHFSNSDRLFAENYGVKFIEAAVFFGWRSYGVDVFENKEQVYRFINFCTRDAHCSRNLRSEYTLPRRNLYYPNRRSF